MTEITISSLLKERMRNTPNKVIIIENNREITWTELSKLSNYAASEFLDAGIKKSCHVGIFSANSLQWIVSYLALTRIGALPIPINYNFKKSELQEISDYANLEYLLYGDGNKTINFYNLIHSIDIEKNSNFKRFIDIGQKRLEEWDLNCNKFDSSYFEYIDVNINTHDPLNMIFTSGTISRMKGIILSHYQMLNIALLQAQELHWTDKDIICLPLPFFHCFGLSCGLFAALCMNMQICLTTTRSVAMFETIEKYKCTVLNGVPSMYKSLMNNKDLEKHDISSLNSGIIAGECVNEKDFLQISKTCHLPNLQQSYGQTETSPAITITDYANPLEIRAKTVGKSIDHIKLRIFDNDKKTIVESGEIGEIQTQGFNVVKNGYYKLEEETKNLYTDDNWLRTGDAGYLDRDNNLYITGRFTEMIIRSGENICPCEIENVILDYKGISQVKIIGIPDNFTGEAIVAVFVCKTQNTIEDLSNFLKLNLADYKIPKYFIQLSSFPQLENGKVDIKKIKKIIFNQLNEEK